MPSGQGKKLLYNLANQCVWSYCQLLDILPFTQKTTGNLHGIEKHIFCMIYSEQSRPSHMKYLFQLICLKL